MTAQPEKGGVLGTVFVQKKMSLGTEVAQRGVLGSLFINYLYFYLST